MGGHAIKRIKGGKKTKGGLARRARHGVDGSKRGGRFLCVVELAIEIIGMQLSPI